MDKIAILILAAGSSSRLGQPKQLLEIIDGITLVEKAAQTAISLNSSGVTIVLGAKSRIINERIKNLPVTIIENPNWKAGMGNSLSFGIEYISRSLPNAEAAIILSCDQIFLAKENLENLVEKRENSGSEIIASKYNDAIGIPVLFDKSLFPELVALSGEKGAKNIISKYQGKLEVVEFEKGEIDIDTEEDLKWLS